MKGIQLLLVVKIIRVEYGNVKRRGGAWARERECVCVWKGFKFSKSVTTLSFEKKKNAREKVVFFFLKKKINLILPEARG